MSAVKTAKKPWTTSRSLQTIRTVFKKLGFRFTERKGEAATTFFAIEADGELEAVHAVYEPGTLAMYFVLGVKPARKRETELLRFAGRFNNMTHSGCVVVRDEGKKAKTLSVALRGTLEHRKVQDVEEGYVASVVAEMMDLVEAVNLPLILIAKGATADAAIAKTLNARVVPIR